MATTGSTGTTGTSHPLPSGWSIGELARRSGLTVRALHHFEDLQLLPPIERDGGGNRVYRGSDVELVYRIVTLRSLGLPLDRIGSLLRDGDPATLAEQLVRVRGQLESLQALETQLQQIVERAPDVEITMEELMGIIRGTRISQELVDEYVTPHEQAALAEAASGLGDRAASTVQVDYPRLYREAQQQMNAGVAPSDQPMQRIAAELEQLGTAWRAGAPAEDGVQRMWAERSEQITGRDYSDLAEYVTIARTHYRSAHQS